MIFREVYITMALQAAFLFLIGDADETTRTVVSTPSIHLNVVGCKNYAEAEAAARAEEAAREEAARAAAEAAAAQETQDTPAPEAEESEV